MIKYHYPIIFSSSVDAGALNKSDDGSAFQVYLERPLLIPREARYCWLTCQAAEIWNTSPNILTGVNDEMPILSGGVLDYTIVIPEGLYDIILLNAEINRQVLENGGLDNDVILYGNSATQKTTIKLLTPGLGIDFSGSQTFRELLGFESVILGPTILANELFDSDNVANFSSVDYYLVHTDIISHGIPVNSKKSQAVAQVLITSPPGNQIIFQPDNPPEIPCNELIGEKKNIINVWLTDQDNRRVSTANEDYSIRLVLYYIVPEQDAIEIST